jgi:hypothetical protein
MAPVFFNPHVCSPPGTADLIGREMDFECRWARGGGSTTSGNGFAPRAVVDSALTVDCADER